MSDVVLTKTVTVLEHRSYGVYATPMEDEVDSDRFHLLRLDADVWNDMGKPVVITVTIQPGDHLNAQVWPRTEAPYMEH